MINNFIGHQKIGTTTTIHHTSTLNLNFLSLIPQKIKWWFQQFSTPWMFNKSWQHFEPVEVHFSTLLAMASVKGEPHCPVSRRSFCHQLRCVVRLGILRANGKKWQSPFLNFYFIDIYVGTPVRVREGTTILTFEGSETKNYNLVAYYCYY